MASDSVPAKKKVVLKSKNSSDSKVPKTSAKASGGKTKPTKSGRKKGVSELKERKLPFLPLVTMWILGVVVLAGLIHWGTYRPEAYLKKARSSFFPGFSSSKDYIGKIDKNSVADVPSHKSSGTPAVQDQSLPPSQEKIIGGENITEKDTLSAEKGASEQSRIEKSDIKVDAIPKNQDKVEEKISKKDTVGNGTDPIQKTTDYDAPVSKAEQPITLALATNSHEATKPEIPQTPPTPPPVAPLARVAIVIDDFGPSLDAARKFVSLPIPVTFSILPHQSQSREIARLAHSQGREVLLHLPMQPIDYPKVDPGPGALLLSMSETTIQEKIRSALDSHPYIAGVNNHMGSRFTEDREYMELVLKELNRRGLYFLDSHTSARSLGHSLGRKLRMPTGQRDIFLDHTVSEKFISSQIEQLIRKAKIQGSAIAIGHPHAETIRVLHKKAKRFQEENIEVVSLGKLIKDTK